jgi:diaminopimelate decarboxylase
LADSIRQHGILSPLCVRKLGDGRDPSYELIAGERRLRAAKLLGLCEVPCIIIEADSLRSAELAIQAPRIILEPGRSLVAAAGVTLYTVGSVKQIPGFRNYVSVDGGMPDNPRYALYQSQYTALIANRAAAPRDFIATVAGRCCESGDLLGEGMPLQTPVRGDILAVLTTGAYNYAMASNYNRLPRPPIVTVSGGKARLAVRRETFEDLVRNDIF